MLLRLTLLSVCFLATAPAHAALNVVATVSSMGALARAVGGAHVKVTVLAPPDRDPHQLTARPSMMADLRRANLLVAVGAELEAAWLGPAIDGANNPNIQPGQPGYFEGAQQVDLIDKGAADRSHGDVHPTGNPHFYMDPVRLAKAGRALAILLGRHDPAHKADFHKNAKALEASLLKSLTTWKTKAQKAPGVVFYHKDGDYLAHRLGVPVQGYIEPMPGLPPTPGHLASLLRVLKGKKGVILSEPFQPAKGGDFLAAKLGWKHRRLPGQPPLTARTKELVKFLEEWAMAVTGS